MGNVLHSVACKNLGCSLNGRVSEGMYTVESGEVFDSPDATGPIRCGVCNQAMGVVYTALNLGQYRSGVNVRNDGLVATSSDGTTCGYGRKVVAEAAVEVLAPGERGMLRVQGVEMHASRSTDGSRVDVTHVGRSDAGVKVRDLGES